MAPTLYIETSVPSYVTGRDSTNVITLGRQLITRKWWSEALPAFDARISELVLQEAAEGDPVAAQRRLELLGGFSVLDVTAEASYLSKHYLKGLVLPDKAEPDALHLAIAVLNGMDYIATWNIRHLAHGRIRKELQRLNDELGFVTPTICTPEELTDEPGRMD
jgi:hypothetical protein